MRSLCTCAPFLTYHGHNSVAGPEPDNPFIRHPGQPYSKAIKMFWLKLFYNKDKLIYFPSKNIYFFYVKSIMTNELIMVLVLEGKSEIGTHVLSKIGFLICLRHLF